MCSSDWKFDNVCLQDMVGSADRLVCLQDKAVLNI